MGTVIGAISGVGVALAIYVFGFGCELINCGCQILTCDLNGGDALPIWNVKSLLTIILFFAICGAVIGLCVDLFSALGKRDEEEAEKSEKLSEATRKKSKWSDVK